MQISYNSRLSYIKGTPISWKERDLLTSVERFMDGIMDFPVVGYATACFPKIKEDLVDKFIRVWDCTAAAYHLHTKSTMDSSVNSIDSMRKAARIYDQEAQRILGSIFPIEDGFWEAFYTRQQYEADRPLVAVDALHYATRGKEQLSYQLLVQSLKAIIAGHYSPFAAKKKHFENAKRLIAELPLLPLQTWLNHQLTYD